MTPRGRTSSTCAANPKGAHAERWRHSPRLRPLLQLPARHGQRPDHRHLSGWTDRGRTPHEPAVPHRSPADASTATARWRSASTASATPAARATRWPPPCSPTTCIWSARSFKYHRPRGIVAAGAEEPNALVTVDRGAGRVTPNLRATQVELYDGLQAHSQNRWPSLRFDLGATADRLSPLLPAGFYYKTFMWPPALWRRLYEPVIRAAAGLGRAPRCARCRPLSAPLRPLRRAGDRRRPRRPCRRAGRIRQRRARHPVRRAGGDRRIAAGGNRGGDRRQAGDGWLDDTLGHARRARLRHAVAAHHRVRLVPRQFHRPGGACHRSPRRARSASAARATVAGARGRGGAGGGRDRTAVGVSAQRPSGRHAGRRGADLPAALRREGGRARRGRDDRRQRLSRRAGIARGGRHDRRHCRCAPAAATARR